MNSYTTWMWLWQTLARRSTVFYVELIVTGFVIHSVIARWLQSLAACIMPFLIKCLFSVVLFAGTSVQQYSGQRLLYIFGKTGNEMLVQQQLLLLDREKEGILERNILIIPVDKNERLQQQFNVSHGRFSVILVGKDGMEKYRTGALLTPKALFAIVDAMPMRKAEMKNQPQ